MRIVDQAKQWTSLRCLRQQAQDRERDQKPVIPSAHTQTKRSTESPRLRAGKLLEVTEDRPQELMQRRERKLGFRLDPDAPEQLHLRHAHTRVLEQRRLAHTSLAADD